MSAPNPGDLPDLDSMFGNPDDLTLKLEACPRCQGVHEGVTFKPFKEADEFTHWAFCPQTSEPVLLMLVFV